MSESQKNPVLLRMHVSPIDGGVAFLLQNDSRPELMGNMVLAAFSPRVGHEEPDPSFILDKAEVQRIVDELYHAGFVQSQPKVDLFPDKEVAKEEDKKKSPCPNHQTIVEHVADRPLRDHLEDMRFMSYNLLDVLKNMTACNCNTDSYENDEE